MTEDHTGADNAHVVTRGPVRTSAIGLAVMAMLALSWLPPEHVHVTHADDGHHSEVIHRHYEAHHAVNHETAVDHDEGELIQRIDSPFIVPTKTWHVSPVLGARPEGLPLEPTLGTSRQALFFHHASVHDPPWRISSGLRDPPDASCLI